MAAPALATHNLPEFTVSEISAAVKRTLEGTFERVRVRGEVSKPNYHGSGHLYFSLKDENAVIDACAWNATVRRLRFRLEHGMEVVVTGRVSSYAGSSKYQIVIDSVELAGQGAILKMLEDRRKRLAAEGLFDSARKKPLPYLPAVIGVITSPTASPAGSSSGRSRSRATTRPPRSSPPSAASTRCPPEARFPGPTS